MVEKTKILILGAKGMLGKDLSEELKDYNPDCWDLNEIDITDEHQVKEKITSLNPLIIINCAAYTDVDGCETDKETCFNVNGKALNHISKTAKQINAALFHISTDYVFNGDKQEGYKEDEQTGPINTYGLSKSEGEKNIIKNTDKYYIIRTAWLFGKNGKNFVNTILKIAKEKPFLEIVDDQFGSPTYTKDLSKQIRYIIETEQPFGIYHITNSGSCSWFEFAKEILDQANIKKKLKPITSTKLKRAAKRPNYSILINKKIPNLRDWKKALKDYLIEIGEANG